MRHCRPTLILARSPRMIQPDCTIVYYIIDVTSLWRHHTIRHTLPFSTIFWLPHNTQLRLTLLPEAYTTRDEIARRLLWDTYRLYVLRFIIGYVLLFHLLWEYFTTLHPSNLTPLKIIAYSKIFYKLRTIVWRTFLALQKPVVGYVLDVDILLS